MALMKCVDCGTEHDGNASFCPNCKRIHHELLPSGVVEIKIPDPKLGLFYFMSPKCPIIFDGEYKPLWRGDFGDTATLLMDSYTEIIIKLGDWANEVKGIVFPGRQYELELDAGYHVLVTFNLREIEE
ncbi:MAG: zinc ribbon domain-containing protein [Clostridia bacterium]|nr:zinc ribbon domain-containing protein [Clostridia bacterium]